MKPNEAQNKAIHSKAEKYNPKTTLMGTPLGKKGLSKERQYHVDAYNKANKR